jgi:hypothetical protein
MDESNYRILQVDGSIELKDYFHAQVDEARTKLIVACGIVVIVIAAFIIFSCSLVKDEYSWNYRHSSLVFLSLQSWGSTYKSMPHFEIRNPQSKAHRLPLGD